MADLYDGVYGTGRDISDFWAKQLEGYSKPSRPLSKWKEKPEKMPGKRAQAIVKKEMQVAALKEKAAQQAKRERIALEMWRMHASGARIEDIAKHFKLHVAPTRKLMDKCRHIIPLDESLLRKLETETGVYQGPIHE